MRRAFLATLMAASLVSACYKEERHVQTQTPAPTQQAAAGAPTQPANPDVMLGSGSTAGALVGAGGTTGGPSGFGDAQPPVGAAGPSGSPGGLVDPMRGTVAVTDETAPPPLVNAENKDVRRKRAYVLQPPTIPHKIDNYQLDRNANKCMLCHARTRAEESKAVPISISHYTDRDGNMLGDISPRRYFCDQCHVVQMEAKPLVGNGYQDVEEIIAREAATRPARK